jgi:lipoprotein-releasing system permease protein
MILFRYLMSSWMASRMRSRSAIGVFLPMLGVAVGVTAFVVVLSVMAGFVRNLEARLLAVDSHIEVVVKDSFGFVPAEAEILNAIQNSHPAVVAVSPFVRGDAILQSSARASTVVLWGVEPASAMKSSDLEQRLGARRLSLLNEELVPANITPSAKFPAIIAGSQILYHVGSEIGDRLTLVSVMSEEGPAGLAPRQYPVVVGDELRSGNPAFDSKVVMANLNFVSRFFGTEGYWSGVQVRVSDGLEVDAVVKAIDAKFANQKLRAKPWSEANKAMVRALKIERWGMKFVMFVVILVACFSITITLVLAVKRKAREMAILRALGLRRKDLGIIFLLHGVGIGLVGVVFGLVLSFAILELVRGNLLGAVTAAYSAGPLPVVVNWFDVVFVSLGSVLLAAVASLWPACEVMRIDVVETISDRGGLA